MRYRWKLLILLLVIGLVPLMAVRLGFVQNVRLLGERVSQESSDNLISATEDKLKLLVAAYNDTINSDRLRLEEALNFQAWAAERCLTSRPDISQTIHWLQDFDQKINLPADLYESIDHQRIRSDQQVESIKISHQAPVFNVPPEASVDQVREDALRLLRLTPVLERINRSLQDRVLWHYTVLENGLYSVYPGHGGLPCNLDVRKQQWYPQGAEHGTAVWSSPYIDPDSRQVVVAVAQPLYYPDQTFAGATALVIPMDRVLNRQALADNLPDGTRYFLSLLKDKQDGTGLGIINYFSEEYLGIKSRSWRKPLGPDWVSSTDENELKAVISDFQLDKSNSRRLSFKGMDSVWVYGPTIRDERGNRMFLLLITPYQEIVRPATEMRSYVEGLLNQLFTFSRLLLMLMAVLIVVLAFLFSRSVTRPIQELSCAAKELAAGNFETRTHITTRDEFGDMGRIFNAVGPQLQAHLEITRALSMAMEVQQNLMPADPPPLDNYDIAGHSKYCNETGGDYYDFWILPQRTPKTLALAVGDVADHGIQSALLMASARAFLRQRSTLPGGPAAIFQDINPSVARDTERTGQFMTMFLGHLELDTRELLWSTAGHAPVMIYDPDQDSFTELYVRSLAIGVLDQYDYSENRYHLKSGQLLIIGTDGITDTHDQNGHMFGLENFQSLIRTGYQLSAEEIIDLVFARVEAFRGDLEQEDDVTMVVIKVL